MLTYNDTLGDQWREYNDDIMLSIVDGMTSDERRDYFDGLSQSGRQDKAAWMTGEEQDHYGVDAEDWRE